MTRKHFAFCAKSYIRVSEEELDKLKQATRMEAYASYSEFIRRTALIEAEKVIRENSEKVYVKGK